MMKKTILALMLVVALILSGCSISITDKSKQDTSNTADKQVSENITGDEIRFAGLSDPKLTPYIEENVYQSILNNIDTTEYFVENVEAIYISQEYIEELSYNSKENIFFGYSISELNKQFEGQKYVFNVDDKGQTKVELFEEYDDTYDQIIKNVAIGTGVILICVTVSVVTAGAGAPAATMIFAGAAKTGTAFALSSAAIGGTISTAVTYSQTGDIKESLKQGTLEASEEFKWGAILGTISGGTSTASTLKGMTRGGLSLNEAAQIQRESKLSADFIKQMKSFEEYETLVKNAKKGGLAIKEAEELWKKTKYPLEIINSIKNTKEGAIYFEKAELIAQNINGKNALVKNFTPEILNYEREVAGKTMTNLEAMKRGYAAINPVTNEAFELHHIGQSVDSPLAILTKLEHIGKDNNSILHDTSIANGKGVHNLIKNSEWIKQKKEFWKAFAKTYGG